MLFECCSHPGSEAREARKLAIRLGPQKMSWIIKQDGEDRKGSWILEAASGLVVTGGCSFPAEEAAMLPDFISHSVGHPCQGLFHCWF